MDTTALAILVLVAAMLPLFFLIRISGRIGETNELLRALLDAQKSRDEEGS